jgi:ADP-heptose:LPS heptosyltransferase
MTLLPQQPEKILILTSSSTGNNVFCTPAIHLLRRHRPNSLIGVASLNQLSAEIFQDNPDINHRYIVSSKRQFNAIAEQYSKIICLNNNAVKKLKGIDKPFFLMPEYRDGTARADQQLVFMAELLSVDVTEEDRKYVVGVPGDENILFRYGSTAEDVIVHLHLGLGRTALHGWKFFYRKRAGEDVRLWPLSNYIALGNLLRTGIKRCRIIITGTQNEAYLARQFAEAVPGTINLVGKTSAMDIFSMMRRINVSIAHDCGVLHIASASDVPIVGIYAPTDPVVAGPYPPRPQHRVIKKATMAEITSQEVYERARELIDKFPRTGR